jgi:uncharacterized protein YdhG (YjbR/CyaY superfamily)
VAKYSNIDEYMANLPGGRRVVMEQIRRTITETAPQAREVIAYNMPAVRLGDRFLASYEAYKHHYSIFPWTERMTSELGDDLKPFIRGKGTVRFPAKDPIPIELVRRIIEIRLREVSERGEGPAATRPDQDRDGRGVPP